MQNVLEHLSARIPILVEILLTGAGVTGLTESDIDFTFFDGEGVTETLAAGDFTLVEADSAEFPGLYLVTEYPIEDTPSTYLTKLPGVVRLKWSPVAPSTFDAGSIDLRVGEDLRHAREVHRQAYQRMEWNVDNERWDLYDEDDNLVGWFLGQDVNGAPAIIEGTHPVTRLAFIANPSYTPV